MQAGHEKTLTAILPALTGGNIIYGLGMLELGITFSFTQLLIDAEIVKMIKRVMQGIAVNDETLALEVIKAVGAGGNYLNQKHTRKYMKQEQSRVKLIDRRMRDRWMEKGGKSMADRARDEALQIKQNHYPQPLTPEVSSRLRAIVEEAENDQ